MKKIVFFVLMIATILFGSTNVYAVNAVPAPVLESSDSVVRIFCGDYTGSGFIVSVDEDKTIVATNYHVVESDPGNAIIWLSKESNITASVLASDKERDLCLLKISAPLNIKPIPLCDQPANKGDAVYAIGFPGAGDNVGSEFALDSDSSTITDGIIGALRQGPVNGGTETVDILQVNTAINAGNSGGPVLNEKGSVVGISTFGITDSQGIFGAVAVAELINLLNANGITYEVEKQETQIPAWAIIAAVAFLLIVAAIVIFIIVKNRKKKTVENSVQQDSTEWTFVRSENGDIQHIDDSQIDGMKVSDIQKQDAENKKHFNWSMVIKIAALAICILFIAAYFVTYEMSKKAADEFKFEQAYNLLFLKPVTQLHDYDHFVYADAGETMNHGNYDAARSQFERLGDYKSAKTLCKECDYQKAKALLTEGKYDEAKEAFAQLGSYADSEKMITECDYQRGVSLMNNGEYDEAEKQFHDIYEYKDSANMANEARYRQATKYETEEDYYMAYLYFHKLADENYKDSKDRYQANLFIKIYTDFYDSEKYLDAYKEMLSLSKEGYQPAKDALKDMKEVLYLAGVNSYWDNSTEYFDFDSEEYFELLKGYEDADKYLTLLNYKNAWLVTQSDIDKVLNILGFADAPEVLVASNSGACEFLLGKWRSMSGGYTFEMKKNSDGGYQSSYNLPAPKIDGYFTIENGVYSVEGTKYFKFSVESEDSMYIHCYKDGNDYYMYR